MQAKRVVLYLARSRPERLLDEMMTELQTVETLNCLIERTETPPFYRLTSMRKATSGHSDGPGTGSQVHHLFERWYYESSQVLRGLLWNISETSLCLATKFKILIGQLFYVGYNGVVFHQDATGRTGELAPVEKGTIHTKRHSGEDPTKSRWALHQPTLIH